MVCRKSHRIRNGAAAVCAAVFLFQLHGCAEKTLDFVDTAGTIEATEVEIAPKAGGRVEWLCCKVGDEVKAGQSMLRLDSREIKARAEEASSGAAASAEALKEAEANLDNAKAQREAVGFELEAASSEVGRVKALATEAKENLGRAEGLFKDGYISRKELDAAKASYDAFAAQLSTASARKLSVEAGLNTAWAAVSAAGARVAASSAREAQAGAGLRAAEALLKDMDIASPINGRIVYKAYEIGEVVKPGSSVYTVHDLGEIWARVDIEETAIGRVKLGSPAKITVKGVPGRVFEGNVIEVGPVGGFATQRDVTRGTQDIKTFRVKVGIKKDEGLLKPGMTVDVHIYSGDKH